MDLPAENRDAQVTKRLQPFFFCNLPSYGFGIGLYVSCGAGNSQ